MLLTVIIVCGVIFFWHDHLVNKGRAMEAVGYAVVIVPIVLCVAMKGSLWLSARNLPDGYEPVTYYYETENGFASDTTSYAKKGNEYYQRCARDGLAWFIPGAPFKYEKINAAKNICPNCEIVSDLDYCVSCGDQLDDGTCRHAGYESSYYCGQCGSKIEKEEK